MNDKELVQQSKAGNQEAFGALVNKYKQKVFNLAFSMTRNQDVADDLAQEVFIKAYFALDKFQHKSEFGTWLYRITVNHTRDHLRKSARLKQIPFEYVENKPLFEDDELDLREAQKLEEERKRVVIQTMNTLPEKHRIILAMRDVRGLSYKEISEILGISPGTVDSRLHRARKLLKKKLIPVLDQLGGHHELPKV